MLAPLFEGSALEQLLINRAVPRRNATAVPACLFGTAVFAHALTPSPFGGGVGIFAAAPPSLLQATACPLQVFCHPSLFFNSACMSACSSNDLAEPCPLQSGIGAETTVLGQPINSISWKVWIRGDPKVGGHLPTSILST